MQLEIRNFPHKINSETIVVPSSQHFEKNFVVWLRTICKINTSFMRRFLDGAVSDRSFVSWTPNPEHAHFLI